MTARRTLGVIGVIFGLVAAACGSTVPQSQQLASNGAAQGLGTGLSGSPVLPPGSHVNKKGQIIDAKGNVIGTTSGGLGSTGGGAAGSSGSSGTTSTGSGTTGGTSAGSLGPGVTASSIALGIGTVTGTTAANQSLGGGAATAIDYRKAWDGLVAYANQHGGIGGRKINPVYHNFDAVSSESYPQMENEACNDWTQDSHVFAALYGPETSVVLDCMQKEGGVVESSATLETSFISSDHARYPTFIEPVALDLDPAATAMARGIARQHYFVQGEKLGLVTYDDPAFKYARDHGLIPALNALNVKLDDTAYLHRPQGYPEYGQLSDDAANAVLKFSTEGIDHVVFIDKNGLAAFFFMQAAAKQSYTPRYGLSSQSGNTALADLLGQTRAQDQLHGAVSIGWVPVGDTHEPNDPATKNPTRQLCMSIMNKNGVSMTSRNAQAQALELCDSIWAFKAQAEAAGQTLNQTTFLNGVAKIGSSYTPGITWGSTLSSAVHDGASAVADMKFYDACTCFKYVSKPYTVDR